MTYLIVTAIITIIYSVIIISFIIGWMKIKIYKKGPLDPSWVFTSVVIAVKNEARNIPDLLNSLSVQTINHTNFEIIIVNDHSTDNTENLILTRNSLPNLKLLNLPDNKNGKKRALQYGISNSKGDLIVTTDADCTHHKQWLETIVNFYIQHKPKLIIAPVLMKSKGFFEHLQALDFFSLIISGAGASGINRPIMCNGANMAFEKKNFEELSDPQNILQPSGDDIFLLINIKKIHPKQIRFLKSQKAVVYTKAEKNLTQFVNQRKRWASKSTDYKDIDIVMVAIFVLLTNFSLAFNLLAGIFITELLFVFVAQLTLKTLFDLCFLYLGTGFFKINKLLRYFIPTQLINIFLIPFIAFLGLFTPVKWKE